MTQPSGRAPVCANCGGPAEAHDAPHHYCYTVQYAAMFGLNANDQYVPTASAPPRTEAPETVCPICTYPLARHTVPCVPIAAASTEAPDMDACRRCGCTHGRSGVFVCFPCADHGCNYYDPSSAYGEPDEAAMAVLDESLRLAGKRIGRYVMDDDDEEEPT